MEQGFNLADIMKLQTDFSQGGFWSFLLSIVFAMVAGYCVSLIYKFYYTADEPIDHSIAKSFPLIAPSVATVFWMIQFSLPLSLGLLGALSFVRFRTPVKRAEDIAFILIVIATSLACAVGHYISALVLLLLLVIFGYVRKTFINKDSADDKFAMVTVTSPVSVNSESLHQTFQDLVGSASIVTSSTHDSLRSEVFNVPILNGSDVGKLQDGLTKIDQQVRVEVYFPNNQINAF